MEFPASPFADRTEAGRRLAERLKSEGLPSDAVVLGLPRGGVVVAWEVAHALALPLDVFVVRKLGVPHQRELAMGALASGGAVVIDEALIDRLKIPSVDVDRTILAERKELARREAAYRGGRAELDLDRRTVVIVDDGLATGSTMRAAVAAIRERRPKRLVIAVPVAAPDTLRALEREADAVVCLMAPPGFMAVGEWYDDFTETTDHDVRELLARARSRPKTANAGRS